MTIFTRNPLTQGLAISALLTAALGCTKDPAPDTMIGDVIIETGYVVCGTPSETCDGVAQCVEANDAQICVQAPADQCIDALTCECVGAWVCGDLDCVDIDGGFTCGDEPQPPPENCLRLVPAAIDFGEVLVEETPEIAVRVEAVCPARVTSVALTDESDPTLSLLDVPFEPYDLAAGESTDLVIVRYTPDAPAEVAGALRLNGNPALDAPITGSAIRPIAGGCLTIEPSILEFGGVSLGESKRLTFQLASDCEGVLESMLDADPGFVITEPIDGPIQAGEGQVVTVEFTPQQAGPASGRLTIDGLGAPEVVTLTADVPQPGIDCRDEGVGCLGALECNTAGVCVTLTQFVFEFEDDAPEMFLQLWPIGEPPYLIIESADNEFTAFNPGSIFKPCDACDAAPDCAEQPDTVGAIGQMNALVWDHTWWLTDTPDGDDCARPQPAPEGLYTASLCGARDANLDGEFDAEGRAPGTVNQSFCTLPVQFDLEVGGDVVLTIPAL